MQNEFDWHYPSLDINILGVNEAGAPLPAPEGTGFITNDRDLPWLQDSDSNSNGFSDVRDETWNVAWRDFVIVDRESELSSIYNLTQNRLEEPQNYDDLKQLLVNTGAQAPMTDWQNPIEPLDVDNDTFIGPLDALPAINALPSNGGGQFPDGKLPDDRPSNSQYLDVNGDGSIGPVDPLFIITHMTNRGPISAAVQAPLSGSAVSSELQLEATDQVFAAVPQQASQERSTLEATPGDAVTENQGETTQERSIDITLANWLGVSAATERSIQRDNNSADEVDVHEGQPLEPAWL